MTEPLAQPGEINHGAVDRYTAGHFSVGVLMGLGRISFWPTALVAVGWELVERPLKNAYPGAFPYSTQDTTTNAVADIVAMMLGWWVFKPRKSTKGLVER